MGYNFDGTGMYIISKFLSKNKSERYYPENITDYSTYASFSCSNYILFMIANNWIKSIDYIFHPKLLEFDFDQRFTRVINQKEFLFEIGLKSMECEELYNSKKNIFDTADTLDIAVPVKCIPLKNFKTPIKYDFICVSQSPDYTVADSDKLIEVCKEYMLLE